jgi:hypothetical protein
MVKNAILFPTRMAGLFGSRDLPLGRRLRRLGSFEDANLEASQARLRHLIMRLLPTVNVPVNVKNYHCKYLMTKVVSTNHITEPSGQSLSDRQCTASESINGARV